MPTDLPDLRQKIKRSSDFTSDERELLLSRLADHNYPSRYPPGTHWATDEAWRILDYLPANAMNEDHRALLGGMIAGALMRIKPDATN
jgi:hypothetical protein